MKFTITEENRVEVQNLLNDFISKGLEVNTESNYFDLHSPIKLVNNRYKPYDEETKETSAIDFELDDIRIIRISELSCHIILN